jgi:hypothetical protein
MKKFLILTVALMAMSLSCWGEFPTTWTGQNPVAEAATVVAPAPDMNCAVNCDGGGAGWRFCSSPANGVYAWDNNTGWWRCQYAYDPRVPAYYYAQYGFLNGCSTSAPYFGWCWEWKNQGFRAPKQADGIGPKYLTCHPGNRMVRCICVQWSPDHRFCWRVEWVPPDPPAPPETVCGINCDPGGSFYCASWSVGAVIQYNGINRKCTSGRGEYWWAHWEAGFGWFTGYPQQLDCPCYYWKPMI